MLTSTLSHGVNKKISENNNKKICVENETWVSSVFSCYWLCLLAHLPPYFAAKKGAPSAENAPTKLGPSRRLKKKMKLSFAQHSICNIFRVKDICAIHAVVQSADTSLTGKKQQQ